MSARLQRLQDSVLCLCRVKTVSARQLVAVLGQMNSLAPLLPLGHLDKRPLQKVSLSVVSSHGRMGTTDFPRPVVCVSNQSLDVSGVPVQCSFDSHTGIYARYTDASLQGGGGHVDFLSVSGNWTCSKNLLHINRFELEAAFHAVQSFVHFLGGKAVVLCTDNRTVACYIIKEGGAQSMPLCVWTEEMLRWCQIQGIPVSARHIPGKLNIVTDALSHSQSILHTEWTLHEAILQQV